jgi:2-oxoglutarate ferredoxin oxidoreductase subunit beta
VRRFQPAAIALAAGASFIARGFSGDPSLLSRLLVQAIRHRGFSFLHVMSPCLTFRPDEKEWKQKVHPVADSPTSNAVEAARLIQADDGMSLGLIYAEDLPVWQPASEASAALAAFEAEFRL